MFTIVDPADAVAYVYGNVASSGQMPPLLRVCAQSETDETTLLFTLGTARAMLARISRLYRDRSYRPYVSTVPETDLSRVEIARSLASYCLFLREGAEPEGGWPPETSWTVKALAKAAARYDVSLATLEDWYFGTSLAFMIMAFCGIVYDVMTTHVFLTCVLLLVVAFAMNCIVRQVYNLCKDNLQFQACFPDCKEEALVNDFFAGMMCLQPLIGTLALICFLGIRWSTASRVSCLHFEPACTFTMQAAIMLVGLSLRSIILFAT